MKEMVGGCCVCSDERGWDENPLVYCDGHGCSVAVHQACYGIVHVPTGPWFCRKCESQERAARVKCELCPSREGALKRSDNGGWCHVICALFIPEVQFGSVETMEPVLIGQIRPERFGKSCYICEEQGRGTRSSSGACMQCNKAGCKMHFHVTCAQALGMLCEETGHYNDNVKYCGYCGFHYKKLKRDSKDSNIKPIPAFKPIGPANATPDTTPEKSGTSPRSPIKPIVGYKAKEAKLAAMAAAAAQAKENSKEKESNKAFKESLNLKEKPEKLEKVEAMKDKLDSVKDKDKDKDKDKRETKEKSDNDTKAKLELIHETKPVKELLLIKEKKEKEPDLSKSILTPETTSPGSIHMSPKFTTANFVETTISQEKDVKEYERSEKGGKEYERSEKGGKEYERSEKGGKEYERSEKGGKEYERSEKGGRENERSEKGGKEYERSEKGGKEYERSEKGGKEYERSEKGGKEYERSEKGGKEYEKSEKCGKEHERSEKKHEKKEKTEKREKTRSRSSSIMNRSDSLSSESTDLDVETIRSTTTATQLTPLTVVIKKEAILETAKEVKLKDGIIPTTLTIKVDPASKMISAPISSTTLPSINSSSNNIAKTTDSSITNTTKTLSISTPTEHSSMSNNGMKPVCTVDVLSPEEEKKMKFSSSFDTFLNNYNMEKSPDPDLLTNDRPAKRHKNKSSDKRKPKKSKHSDGDVTKATSTVAPESSESRRPKNCEYDWPMSSPPATSATSATPASSLPGQRLLNIVHEPQSHTATSYNTTSEHLTNGFTSAIPAPPSQRHTRPSKSTTTGVQPFPTTLEQLLERQWEQGSQFVLEQAQHFDIASLLNCLHQLRAENTRLEDYIATLTARRDNLLAINARLGVPITASSSSSASLSTAASASAASTAAQTAGHVTGHISDRNRSSPRTAQHHDEHERNASRTILSPPNQMMNGDIPALHHSTHKGRATSPIRMIESGRHSTSSSTTGGTATNKPICTGVPMNVAGNVSAVSALQAAHERATALHAPEIHHQMVLQMIHQQNQLLPFANPFTATLNAELSRAPGANDPKHHLNMLMRASESHAQVAGTRGPVPSVELLREPPRPLSRDTLASSSGRPSSRETPNSSTTAGRPPSRDRPDSHKRSLQQKSSQDKK